MTGSRAVGSRAIDGALLLDKPLGLSSNAALQQARRALGARKAGHAGTLDPLASGLLVVLFGEATKFAGTLLEQDKEYEALARLGARTATGDAEGEVLETGPQAVPEACIAEVLPRFTGRISQVPPMYSALKRDGVPLYALARRGETVERPARTVEIRRLECLRYEPPELALRVACSKGTYIRTLVEDLASALGTVAHLAALRRTRSGAFPVEEACTLPALLEMSEAQRRARIVPLEALLEDFPRVRLDPAAEERFRNGQAVPMAGAGTAAGTAPEGLCAVFSQGGTVIGLGSASGSALRPVRLTASPAASQAADPP